MSNTMSHRPTVPRNRGNRARDEVFAALPPVWPDDLSPRIRAQLAESRAKLVVLDDDPTGTQTVYDIPVLTQWEPAILERELNAVSPGFYLLTNSRSLSPAAADALNRRTACELKTAADRAGCKVIVVSRSDSTLRGHYPLETDVLAEGLGPFDGIWLAPYFEAGGRYTIHGVHYVLEQGLLVPASETPFARDPVFGFREAALARYVQEKTDGRVSAADVVEITLEELREGGPEVVFKRLIGLRPGFTGFVNAAHPRDLEVFVHALHQAEREGRIYLFRTAAQFVAARLGLEPRPLWVPGTPDNAGTETGGLTVVGSHVPKSTAQLERLRGLTSMVEVELRVPALLDARTREPHLQQTAEHLNRLLDQGNDVVLATSRQLVSGHDAEANLEIGRRVSESLVHLVSKLRRRPRYLIAKGGITSSDIATQGLGVRRALVLGQILPGVPVWELGSETRFPGLPYVVFPGNVGGPEALLQAVNLFRDSTLHRPAMPAALKHTRRAPKARHEP